MYVVPLMPVEMKTSVDFSKKFLPSPKSIYQTALKMKRAISGTFLRRILKTLVYFCIQALLQTGQILNVGAKFNIAVLFVLVHTEHEIQTVSASFTMKQRFHYGSSF